MDNSNPDLLESDSEPKPDELTESQPQPERPDEVATKGYVNENITKAVDLINFKLAQAKDHYNQSPRLKRFLYQGKYKPAFWTVTAIFSLFVNILFIALLIFFGRFFFELKNLVAEGLVTRMSDNLALMDKAHIVAAIPVETTVQLQDELPVVFDLPINQSTQLSLTEDTRIAGAYIYLNNTAVMTDLTLPAGTPIQANINITIPVSESVPVDVTVPVSLRVPIDLSVDQTDLHQAIVGLQDTIEPYKVLLGSNFNSPKDFPLCNQWWSGWLCVVIFGQQ